MLRALPLLASADLRATADFYRRLGFASKGAPHEEWDYLIIEYDGGELHFAGPMLGERVPGSCFVYTNEIDDVYAEWTSKADANGRFTPLSFTNFGMRMFTMFDPDGNEIRVGSPAR
jgi:hypothetical protein